MNNLTAEQEVQIDADAGQCLASPMPRELRAQIGDRIEAHTINMYLKHHDVMECIEVACLVIREYLAAGGTL